MSGSGRPLLAARASSGEGSKDGAGSATPPSGKQPGGRPKRTLIESACSACRRRKSRCDGLRPTCSRCQNLRTECQYEAEEGESRWSALRRRNQILETERDQVRELFAFLHSRSEPEALEIFQHIRHTSHDDVFSLLRQIKEGSLTMITPTMGSLPAAAVMVDQQPRLPPIQAILDVPGRGMQPASSLSLSSEDSRTSSSNPEFAPIPFHPSARRPPDTLEPSPSPSHPKLLGPQISLSSEESMDSMNLDLSSNHRSTP